MDWNELLQSGFLIKVAAAIIELIIGMFLARWVRNWILKMKPIGMDKGVLTFGASAAGILVTVLAIIIALGQIGVNLDILIGAFSAVGLGVSLALKESMANVAGGLQILLTRPFKVGDYIEYGETGGTVKQIELMFTSLQTPNLQQVVIPNASLVSGEITNYSAYPNRRIVISVPISTGADYRSFRAEAQDLLEQTDKILKDPAPKTAVSGFTASGNGMTINVICYSRTSDYWDMVYYLYESLQALLQKVSVDQPVDLIKIISDHPGADDLTKNSLN